MKRKDFSKLKLDVQNKKNFYFEHEKFTAGVTPFLRGIHSSMYLQHPIENCIPIDFPSSEKCNTFLKEQISKGIKAFKFHFNTDQKDNNNGIIATSANDFQHLFDDVNLLNLDITLSSNSDIIATITIFLEGMKLLDISTEDLNLSIQLNTDNSTKEPIKDVYSFLTKHLPKLKYIKISDSIKNKITTEFELANLLTTSNLYLQEGISKGELIDKLAPKISFNLNVSENHFDEISKIRAARLLWSKLIHEFKAKNQQSFALQLHTTTNNTIDTLSSFLGGAQSLTSKKVTTLYIEEETNILKTVDPWAGSSYIEKRTLEISKNAWQLFKNNK